MAWALNGPVWGLEAKYLFKPPNIDIWIDMEGSYPNYTSTRLKNIIAEYLIRFPSRIPTSWFNELPEIKARSLRQIITDVRL